MTNGIEWNGVYPAILTPFTNKDTMNDTVLRELARFLLDQGCHGFFTCGSAGEGLFMSVEERKHALDVVVDAVRGKARIIAHVGAMSTRDTVMLAEHAAKSGADAVCALPPMYFKQPWDACIAHLRAVAVAAQCPTFYYHIPHLSHVPATAEELLRMAHDVPHFAGIKFSAPDLFTVGAIRRTRDDLAVLMGCDDILYQSILTGACGGIGSTYNYQPANIVGVYNATRAGDHQNAKACQDRVTRVIEVLFKYGANRGTEKAMTQLLGFDVGPPRLPTQPFPKARLDEMKRDMQEVGML